jgi:methylmalonyl-CoA/ethylmalonyl-CoA epimerase
MPSKEAAQMQAEDAQEVKLPGVGQIGVVVRDLDMTMEYYSSNFGIGPWRIVEIDHSTGSPLAQKPPWKARAAFAQLGPVELELLQIVEGRPIHSEFLERNGEGLHHLGFFVSNEEMDNIMEEMAGKGIGILQGGKTGIMGRRNAYLDTEETGGVIFELIHRPDHQ